MPVRQLNGTINKMSKPSCLQRLSANDHFSGKWALFFDALGRSVMLAQRAGHAASLVLDGWWYGRARYSK